MNRSFTKKHTWEEEDNNNILSNTTLIEKQETENNQQNNKIDMDNSGILCNICFANDSDCIFMPCGHGGVCLDCSKDVIKVQGECYLCRTPIEYVLKYNNADKKDDMFKITELHQFE